MSVGAQNLDSSTLAEMSSLESLDLSRNNIAELPNGTLASLSRLKTLQFGVNTLRKVRFSFRFRFAWFFVVVVVVVVVVVWLPVAAGEF